jgi:hypothetical protein
MKLPRDPADVRRGEALALAVDPQPVAAGGAALGSLLPGRAAPESAQERALLTDRVDGHLHTEGFSDPGAG